MTDINNNLSVYSGCPQLLAQPLFWVTPRWYHSMTPSVFTLAYVFSSSHCVGVLTQGNPIFHRHPGPNSCWSFSLPWSVLACQSPDYQPITNMQHCLPILPSCQPVQVTQTITFQRLVRLFTFLFNFTITQSLRLHPIKHSHKIPSLPCIIDASSPEWPTSFPKTVSIQVVWTTMV